jgi:two-component system chemotaxis response regulator CheY
MAKILVIDDSTSVRNQVSEALRVAGHSVIEAVDGSDGLEKIISHPDVDVIITDYNMPGYDGLTMLKNAKSALGVVNYVVFVLTTETSEKLKAQGKEVGVAAWVIKPFSAERLNQAINKVLALKKASSDKGA